MKRALITGASGQDGTYLAEFLLQKGYLVFGLVRRNAETNEFTRNLVGKVHYLYGDMRDDMSLVSAIRKAWPDEVYNLAAQSSVPPSWDNPGETFDINVGGLARILQTLDRVKQDCKVYQASSSEMFGDGDGVSNEFTPLQPVSPYAVSKVAAHQLARVYREKGLFVSCGMLFNHESPRRGHEFVTRKIAAHVARWSAGEKSTLSLGNINSRRDWGFAGDYVEAMWLMLQSTYPANWVVGMGQSHSVKDFLLTACHYAGVAEEFCWKHVYIDPRLTRNGEIRDMIADEKRAKEVLGWQPKVDFETLVGMMVQSEQERLKQDEQVTLTRTLV